MYASKAIALRRLFFWCWLALLPLAAQQRASAGEFDRGLLWRIEAPSAKPSYLFGTIHSEDPRVIRLAPPVQRAFERAARVTLEVTLDAATLVRLTSAMLMADGRELRGVIGAPLYRRTLKVMADYGMPEKMVSRMKPWAVATTLMVPRSQTGLMLDALLYRRALGAGKPVDGLETAEEQIAVFDGMEEALQVTLLKDTLDNLPAIDRLNRDLLEAYLRRDLKQMMVLNERSMRMGDRELASSLQRRAIVERNQRMIQRMESRLRQGNAFIAVGALHLPGPQGLLALLRQKGYRVSVVY